MKSYPSFVVALLCVICAGSRGADRPTSPQHLYHGAAYYPELWPESDIDHDIVEMKKVGINMVRMGEFAWAKMEPDEGKITLDFFVRVMDKLNAAGIKTVFCTPTATPPIWLVDGHPERCFVDQDGTVMVHGARQHASYDNPDVWNACMRITEAVAKTIGKHPGLIGWQIDNELKCHVAEDYSPSAVLRWHNWLKDHYLSIDALNTAWGTEIWSQRYQRFDQVPAPRKTPFLHNASLSTAYLMSSREMIAGFADAQAGILRKYSSAPVTTNMHLFFAVSLERMCQNLDFAAFDAYPSYEKYLRLVMNFDLFRAAKPDRPFWLMETSSAHNGWLSNFDVIHPPGYLTAEAVAAYGMGCETMSYWLWRQQRTGAELPHSAILSAWNKPGSGYESVKQVEVARKLLEPVIARSYPSTPEVGVTWSDRGRVMLQVEPIGANSDYKYNFSDAIADWHELLVGLGLPRDIRFENAPLDGLKLLITPAMPYVSNDFRRRVEAWIRDGGVWICGPVTGMRTQDHTVNTDAALGALEKLAGVETMLSFPSTNARLKGSTMGATATLTGWCNAFRAVDPETQLVGSISGELAAGLGFLTERKLGHGTIVMLGAQPEGEEGRKMLAKITSHYAEQAGVKMKYTSSGPGTLVCPRTTSDGHSLWIVVNMDGAGGRVDLPLAGKDAFTGTSVAAGPIEISRYGYRAIEF